MDKLKRIVEFLEQTPLTLRTWCVSFFTIVLVRLLVENLLGLLKDKPLSTLVGSFLQTLLFFCFSYVIILLFLWIFTRYELKKLAAVLLWGQWVIIFPPIWDKLIFGSGYYYSFYIFDSVKGVIHRFFTFFGDNPEFGITYGTRIEVLLVSLLLAFYLFVKSRRMVFSLLMAIGLYTLLFLLGCFPSLVVFVVKGWSLGWGQIDSVVIAKFFLTPLRFFGAEYKELTDPLNYKLNLIYNLGLFGVVGILQLLIGKRQFWAIFRNIRFPQVVFNSGLLLVGLGLGWFYFRLPVTGEVFTILVVLNLLLAVLCSWGFSVFVNDLNDIRIDQLTNQDRPLVKNIFTQAQYWDYSLVFLFFSLSSSLIVGGKFFLIVVVYHLLTWAYSSPPFRLKRFVGVASVLSSFASLLFLALGYILASPDQSLDKLPWRLVGLLFVGYALAIPLKDIKDIDGDKKDGVFTLPVLLGEENTRLTLATIILAYYFLAVFWLNERLLFWPSLACGAMSFWVITNKKIAPRTVNWLVLLVAGFYVIILTAILIKKI